MRSLVLAVVVALAACGDRVLVVDGAAPADDAGVGDLGLNPDGAAELRAAFTIVGCARLEFHGAEPRCTGPAPLELTFVPLAAGASTYLWSFAGGQPDTSSAISPVARFPKTGTFMVTLTAAGGSGSSTASGVVAVSSGAVGDPCLETTDCDKGLTCLCAEDPLCPASLRGGLCTRGCGGSDGCDPGELCVDLSRGAPGAVDGGTASCTVDGGASVATVYRRALCLPSCMTDGDCTVGLRCRALPSLAGGAVQRRLRPGSLPGGGGVRHLQRIGRAPLRRPVRRCPPLSGSAPRLRGARSGRPRVPAAARRARRLQLLRPTALQPTG
jgi:hypothetical protein